MAALVAVEDLRLALCLPRASSSASTQKPASIVIDTRMRKHRAPAEPVDDGDKIDEAARHRDVGYVRRPDWFGRSMTSFRNR